MQMSAATRDLTTRRRGILTATTEASNVPPIVALKMMRNSVT